MTTLGSPPAGGRDGRRISGQYDDHGRSGSARRCRPSGHAIHHRLERHEHPGHQGPPVRRGRGCEQRRIQYRFAASGRHQAATADRHRDGIRLCRRMDRAIARRRAAAESSRLRCRHAIRRGNSGEQRRGRTAGSPRDGALGRRRLRRGLGRQAQRRTHPRAALRARHHEKRRGVSRQYDRQSCIDFQWRLVNRTETS